MKPLIGFSFIFLLAAGCNATRPPIDPDAIDAGAVQRIGWRPSGPPNKPVSWEDSIDAGAVRGIGYRPSASPNKPVAWEDSIDAGRVNPAWRPSSSGADKVACPAADKSQEKAGLTAGGS